MTESLRSALKQLRLSGLLESLEMRLHEAAGNSLTHAETARHPLQVVRVGWEVDAGVDGGQYVDGHALHPGE